MKQNNSQLTVIYKYWLCLSLKGFHTMEFNEVATISLYIKTCRDNKTEVVFTCSNTCISRMDQYAANNFRSLVIRNKRRIRNNNCYTLKWTWTYTGIQTQLTNTYTYAHIHTHMHSIPHISAQNQRLYALAAYVCEYIFDNDKDLL